MFDCVYRQVDLSHIEPSRFACRAMPGVVAVEMAPRDEHVGSIFVPGVAKTLLRSDVAKVIAVGARYSGVWGKQRVVSDPSLELEPGDTVLVRADRGDVYAGFGWDERVARSEVRVYGQNGGPGTFVQFHRYSFDEGILAKVVDERPRAVGRRVLFKFGQMSKSSGGVDLLREVRDPVCEVLSVGAQVREVAPGDKVVVASNAITRIEGFGELIGSCLEDAVQLVRD